MRFSPPPSTWANKPLASSPHQTKPRRDMESLSKFHSTQPSFALSADHHRPSFSRPVSSVSLRRPPSIPSPFSRSSQSQSPTRLSVVRAASTSSTPQNPKTPFFETLKPLVTTAFVAAVAAAVFLVRPDLRPALAEPAIADTDASADPTTADAEPADGVADEEQEKTLEEHLESHPEDVPTLRSLLGIKLRSEKIKEALDIVDHLIAVEPGEGDWPLMKAHILVNNGDPETAKSMFEDVLAEDPLHVEAFHGLVMAATETGGDLDEVLKRVLEALEKCKKEKDSAKARDFKLLVGQIKVIEGKYGDALKAYQEVVKEDPRDFRVYLCLGIVYTLMKKKNEADAQFKIYRQLVPRGHPLQEFYDVDLIAKDIMSQMQEK